MMDRCIFCQIAQDKIPSTKIYEDGSVLAFLDINPATPYGGHVLVIPKEHYLNIVDIPKETLFHLFEIAQKLSKALMKIYDGVNLIQNNGRSAGQLVEHFHIHLIPRFDDDNLKIASWKPHKYKPGEAEGIAQKIKTYLN